MSADNPTSWDMSGYDRDINWGNIPIEIVDLPNLKMAIFHSYVSLPEGKGVMDGFGGDLTIANGDLIFFQKGITRT